jgi:uncharacterized protein (DUF1919 family)
VIINKLRVLLSKSLREEEIGTQKGSKALPRSMLTYVNLPVLHIAFLEQSRNIFEWLTLTQKRLNLANLFSTIFIE